MANDIRKKVIIDGDAKPFEDKIKRAGRVVDETFDNKKGNALNEMLEETSDLFSKMAQDSEKFSKSAADRAKYIEREIKDLERSLNIQQRITKEQFQQRIAKEKELKERLAPGMQRTEAEKKIREEEKQFSLEEEEDENVNQLQINELRKKLNSSMFEKKNEKGEIIEEGEGHEKNEHGRFEGAKEGLIENVGVAGEAYGVGGLIEKSANIGQETAEGIGLDPVKDAAAIAAGALAITAMVSSKAIEEGIKYQSSTMGLLGLGASPTKSSFLDQTAEQMNEKAFELARLTGNSGMINHKSIIERSQASYAIERGIGLTEQPMAALGKVLRGQKSEDADEAMIGMYGMFKKSDVFNVGKGDTAQMEEKMELFNTQLQQQLEQIGSVNPQSVAKLVTLGGLIGQDTNFGNANQAATFSKMNQALVNPNTDIKRAFLFRTLASVMPQGSDVYDIMRQQEEGIYGEGTLEGVIGNVNKMSGGNKKLRNLQLKSMLGLSIHDTEALTSAFDKNPDLLKNIQSTSPEEIEKLEKQINSRAATNVPEALQKKAAIETGFGNMGDKMIDALNKIIDLMQGGKSLTPSNQPNNKPQTFMVPKYSKDKAGTIYGKDGKPITFHM